MSEITLADVIGASYKWTEEGMALLPAQTKKNTALLLIDIQELATPDSLGDIAIREGLDPEGVQAALADYRTRFDAALKNAQAVLQAARENGIPAIHVKIECMTTDGRDCCLGNKLLGWIYPPGSKGSQFLEACRPEPGEMVLTKTVSGAFTGTALDRKLRHMGIEYLHIAGFMSDECVETTFRDAVDHGYLAFIVGDATTAYFAESHNHVIEKFSGWGLVTNAEQAIQTYAALPDQ